MNKTVLVLLVLLASAGMAQATQLGMNYYQENRVEASVEIHDGLEQTKDVHTTQTTIESLQASCELQGIGCEPISDTTAGDCRAVEWSTNYGPIKIEGCQKETTVEVYRKQFPNTQFSACLGEEGCVDQWSGWTSFSLANTDTPETDTGVEEPTSEDSFVYDDINSPVDRIDATGLAEKYEAMLQAWQGREIDHVTADGKELIVVPWFVNEQGDYHRNCGAAGTQNDYCVVTDEDSQYTLAVSMSRDEQLVNAQAEALFNKIRHVSTTDYGRNARWQFRVRNGAVELNTNDFASDADARYLLALFSFASNPVLHDEALKNEMRSYAEGYCADYKQHAFVVDEHAGIRYWPVGGGDVGRVGSLAESSNWWGVTYPGYYGDMSLAMLACGANTQDQEYFAVADDALKAYFSLAGYDGSSLSIAHGRSGTWNVDDSGDVSYVCQDGCPGHGGTENADGVRFTSMCTVDYFAQEMGLGFTPLTNQFCSDVISSNGFERTAYATQWDGNGQPVSGLNSGWQANGLPLYIDVGRTSYAGDRFNSVWDNQWTGSSFSNAQLFDVFWGGFLVNGLGFNLGRADAVFALSSTAPVYGPVQPPEESPGTGDSEEEHAVEEPVEDVVEHPSNEQELSIDSMGFYCSAGGVSCQLRSDSFDGACRELAFSTINGELVLKGCSKPEGTAELYLLAAPSTSTFAACLGDGCVSELSGFARYVPGEPAQEPIDEQPAVSEPEESSIMQLSASVTPSSNLVVDAYEETSCRRLTYDTASGSIDVRVCPRPDGAYELYRLSERNDAQLCIQGACVGTYSGFARIE